MGADQVVHLSAEGFPETLIRIYSRCFLLTVPNLFLQCGLRARYFLPTCFLAILRLRAAKYPSLVERIQGTAVKRLRISGGVILIHYYLSFSGSITVQVKLSHSIGETFITDGLSHGRDSTWHRSLGVPLRVRDNPRTLVGELRNMHWSNRRHHVAGIHGNFRGLQETACVVGPASMMNEMNE